MTPTFTSYFQGLRRMWWLVVGLLVAGVGLGYLAAGSATPTRTTSASVLFTNTDDDPGAESAGAARQAEMEVAQSRLSSYAQLIRNGGAVRDLLTSFGIEEKPTSFTPTGGFKEAGASTLIDVADEGIVQIKVQRTSLPEGAERDLVSQLSDLVVSEVLTADGTQENPSLRPNPLVLAPQTEFEPPATLVLLGLPIILSLGLGLIVVYLVEWRRGRVYGRNDLEVRLGAQVLGEVRASSGDATPLVLALRRGRSGSIRAALVPAALQSSRADLTWIGESVAEANRILEASHGGSARGTVEGAESHEQASSLEILDLTGRPLDAQGMRTIAGADVVGVVVEYGRTPLADVVEAGEVLSQITDAELATIAVRLVPASRRARRG